MTLTKVVAGPNGGTVVELTAEEIAARESEEAAWLVGAPARKDAKRDAELRAAFRDISDPLFFQEQRGEVPAGTWEAKVHEIRLEINAKYED